MKVIDLLNKIANGEEVPKKIKYRGILYTYDKKYSDYLCGDSEEYYNDALLFPHSDNPKEFLNYEVEIIEDTSKEDKKIEKLDLHYTSHINDSVFKKEILAYCDNLQYKINEIIDKINGGEE